MKDLHMHTVYSDGKNTIEEMVKKAVTLSLQTIAFTDHVWQTSNWFEDYLREISFFQHKYQDQIVILPGFEAKAINTKGDIDANHFMINNSKIKIGAMHRIPFPEQDRIFYTREQIISHPQQAYHSWLTTTLNLLKNPHVDILAHPFMVPKKYNLDIPEKDLIVIFKYARQFRKFLEISCRYPGSNTYMWQILKKYPGYLNHVILVSDSHSITDLENCHKT